MIVEKLQIAFRASPHAPEYGPVIRTATPTLSEQEALEVGFGVEKLNFLALAAVIHRDAIRASIRVASPISF